MEARPSSIQITGNALAMASMVLWATSFPATGVLLETWHPLAAAIGRQLVGAMALLLLMGLRGKFHELRVTPWRRVFVIGGVGLSLATIFLNIGIYYSNPITAAIIATMMPPVAFVMAIMAGEERFSPKLLAGIALAVSGGIWASLQGVGTAQGSIGFEGGEPLLLLAVSCFAWYSRATVKHLPMLSKTTITATTLLAGSIVTTVLVAFCHFSGLTDVYYTPTVESIALMVWIAAIANGYAMVLWLSGVARIGVTVASFHQNLVPFYVMLVALALGGAVIMQQIVGALIVIAGVIVTQWPSRKATTQA